MPSFSTLRQSLPGGEQHKEPQQQPQQQSPPWTQRMEVPRRGSSPPAALAIRSAHLASDLSMMAAAEKAAFSLGRRRRRGEAAWALPHSLYHNKTLFLGPVANGRRVRPRVLAHRRLRCIRPRAPRARDCIPARPAAHCHGRQTWPRGRATAHARFPHARPLKETDTCVSLEG